MFQRYRRAEPCYAFLADYDSSVSSPELQKSRWFTRGWTLQELITPRDVQFFECKWKQFGSRDKMKDRLSMITRIDNAMLKSSRTRNITSLLDSIPVARRMSWAASRQTTRIEDIAYSLLGVFQVTMPLVYGEGDRAFIRLQEEIIKKTNDLTLVAWTAVGATIELGPSKGQVIPILGDRGILAASPCDFADTPRLVLANDLRLNPEFGVSNKGLRIQHDFYETSNSTLFMGLRSQDGKSGEFGILLKHVAHGIYIRSHPERLDAGPPANSKASFKSIYISLTRQSEFGLTHFDGMQSSPSFYVAPKLLGFSSAKAVAGPPEWRDSSKGLFVTHDMPTFLGYYIFGDAQQYKYSTRFAIVFGFNEIADPWVCIATNRQIPSLYPAAVKGDLQILESLVKQKHEQSLSVKHKRDGNTKRSQNLSVSLTRVLSEGWPVYVIDLQSSSYSTSGCILM